MQVGCLGDIAFEVSNNVIKTIKDVQWSGSVTIQSHARHLNNALQEFVSVDPDGITFSMTLSRYLGADVNSDINKLFDYERSGKAVKFVLGAKTYGKYRWLIKKHKITMEHFDKQGNLASADVNVTLVEYTKG